MKPEKRLNASDIIISGQKNFAPAPFCTLSTSLIYPTSNKFDPIIKLFENLSVEWLSGLIQKEAILNSDDVFRRSKFSAEFKFVTKTGKNSLKRSTKPFPVLKSYR